MRASDIQTIKVIYDALRIKDDLNVAGSFGMKISQHRIDEWCLGKLAAR